VSQWEQTAKRRGIGDREIEQLSSAFQQDDIKDALAFTTIAAKPKAAKKSRPTKRAKQPAT
jgi:hypothetical protein